MKTRFLLILIAAVFLISADAMAQRGGGRGGRGGPGGGGRGGPPPNRGGTERLIDDLALNNQQRASAQQAIAAYDQTLRDQTMRARADLLATMQSVLPADQFSQFKEDLEQVPLVPNAPNQLRGVATNELTTRLLSYDGNSDGKITKEELPERMLNLIAQGDTNSDGTLDRAEINALAARNSFDDPPQGRGGGPGRGGRAGRGPGGGRGN
jgi:hypothetical protein